MIHAESQESNGSTSYAFCRNSYARCIVYGSSRRGRFENESKLAMGAQNDRVDHKNDT